MPSNKDLIADIEAEAKAKGIDAPATSGKSNVELIDILKNLKTPPAPNDGDDKKDGDQDDAAKAAADEAEKIKPAKAVKRPPYYMVDGKALTTKKGILSDGDEIKPEYLAGGKSALEKFIKSGHVAKG